MANYGLVYNGQFTPRTYDEIVKPLVAYKERYDQVQDYYTKLGDQAAMIEQMADDEATRQLVAEYKDTFNQGVDALAKGLSLGDDERMLAARKSFNDNMSQIATAYGKKQEAAKFYQENNLKHRLIGLDPNSTTTGQWLNGNNPIAYQMSGNEIALKAASATKGIMAIANTKMESNGVYDYFKTQEGINNAASLLDQALAQQIQTGQVDPNNPFSNIFAEAMSVLPRDAQGNITVTPEDMMKVYNEIYAGAASELIDKTKLHDKSTNPGFAARQAAAQAAMKEEVAKQNFISSVVPGSTTEDKHSNKNRLRNSLVLVKDPKTGKNTYITQDMVKAQAKYGDKYEDVMDFVSYVDRYTKQKRDSQIQKEEEMGFWAKLGLGLSGSTNGTEYGGAVPTDYFDEAAAAYEKETGKKTFSRTDYANLHDISADYDYLNHLKKDYSYLSDNPEEALMLGLTLDDSQNSTNNIYYNAKMKEEDTRIFMESLANDGTMGEENAMFELKPNGKKKKNAAPDFKNYAYDKDYAPIVSGNPEKGFVFTFTKKDDSNDKKQFVVNPAVMIGYGKIEQEMQNNRAFLKDYSQQGLSVSLDLSKYGVSELPEYFDVSNLDPQDLNAFLPIGNEGNKYGVTFYDPVSRDYKKQIYVLNGTTLAKLASSSLNDEMSAGKERERSTREEIGEGLYTMLVGADNDVLTNHINGK